MVGTATLAQLAIPLPSLHTFFESIWQSEQKGERCKLDQTVINLLRKHQSVLHLGQVAMNKGK